MAATILTGAGNVTTDSSSSDTSLTMTKPANLADGHLMIAGVMFRNTGAGSSGPAGWSLFTAEALDNGTTEIFYKAVPSAAAETATDYTWTTGNGANRCCGFVALVSGADLVSPEDAAGTTSVNAVAPSITTATANALLVAVNCVNIASATPLNTTAPTGMTEAVEVSAPGTSTTTLQLSQEVITAAGVTGTRTFTFSGTPGSQRSFMFSIEAGVTSASKSGSDSAALTDTAALTQSRAGTDSAALADASASAQALSRTDSAAAAESTVTAATNLAMRPSAEVTPVFGLGSGWASFALPDDPALVRDTTRGRFGSCSVRFDWPTGASGGGAGYVADDNLVIGQQYTASVYVWVPTGSPHLQLKAFFIADGTSSSVNDQWQRLTVTWTAAAIDDYLILVSLSTPASGQSSWADAFQIETGTAATSYIDGDQPAGRWTGTPHQSTSVREALVEGFAKTAADDGSFAEAATETTADDNADTGALTAETAASAAATTAGDAAALTTDSSALSTHDPVGDSDQAALDDQATVSAPTAVAEDITLVGDEATLEGAVGRVDSASAADTAALGAALSRLDLGITSETSALGIGVAPTDAAAVTDTAGVARAAALTDAAVLNDAGLLAQSLTAVDSTTLTDAATSTAAATPADTGTVTDTAAGTAAVTAADAAAGAELSTLNADGLIAAGDTAALLTETASVTGGTQAADAGTLAEGAAPAAGLDVTDTAAADATSAGTAAPALVDTGTLTDTAVLTSNSVDADGADVAALAEAAAVVTAALARMDFAVLGETAQIGASMSLETFDIIATAETAQITTGSDQLYTLDDGADLTDFAWVDVDEDDATLVVSVETVAARMGLSSSLDAAALHLIEEAIRDRQSIVEAYLGIPITPTEVTETGRWPALDGWVLTREPVVAVVDTTAETDVTTGVPTGLYTVTYTWGLDAATGAEYEPIRRWVAAHAAYTPETRRLARTDDATAGGTRVIRSLSAEGQAVSYADAVPTAADAAGLTDAAGLPTLRTLDRWRRANRRVYQRPAGPLRVPG